MAYRRRLADLNQSAKLPELNESEMHTARCVSIIQAINEYRTRTGLTLGVSYFVVGRYMDTRI